ncbi:MAG TPA: hypothetical protein PKO44_05545 [Candidatus Omnitrophota bacterium]|nr:hypothetical protein [Candidatus Omnitrophota bacterium]
MKISEIFQVKRLRLLAIIFALANVLFLSFLSPLSASDTTDQTICLSYLTGVGCSNCAVVDPTLFQKLVSEYPNLIVLEYEIYHKGKENQEVKDRYFQAYNNGQPGGVPFLVFGKDKTAMGRIKVAEALSQIDVISSNSCPLPDGTSIDFNQLDIAQLPGKVSIWTKNRVLIREEGQTDNVLLRKLLLEPNIWKAMSRIKHEKTEAFPVEISQGMISFDNAIRVGGWVLQWNDDPNMLAQSFSNRFTKAMTWFFPLLLFFLLFFAFLRIERTGSGMRFKICIPQNRRKDYLLVAGSAILLLAFFILVKALDPKAIEQAGYYLPLPLFTVIIGFIDGFNPCNMFVLTCLMALLVSTSDSRVRLYIVGLSFVVTVFLLYFLFMAAWLNVFQYISFISPLRIGIGVLSLVAGVINCKDFLFFKKGISLTIPDAQRGPLMKKVYAMKHLIQQGSYPVLILSSIALAVLSSLVEIPCTAGFPIIYTGILSGKALDNTASYYLYLAFYNLLYVFPLLAIVSIFIVSFKGQPISQRQMEILKFIGGLIMILLGVVLLVNPSLVGISIG